MLWKIKCTLMVNNYPPIHRRERVITSCIPKEWGRHCFHRCLSVNISGGGVPTFQLRRGGFLQANRGYLPWLWPGVPPSIQSRYACPSRSTPSPVQGRYPLPLEIEQHSEYLQRGERYVSCVNAGGLSCML